jgi:hypothetical protein
MKPFDQAWTLLKYFDVTPGKPRVEMVDTKSFGRLPKYDEQGRKLSHQSINMRRVLNEKPFYTPLRSERGFQMDLGQFHEDFPSPYGPVRWYHGTDERSAKRIKDAPHSIWQGILPHDETTHPTFEGKSEFGGEPTTSVAQSKEGAQMYAIPAMFGIRGTAEELGLTERAPDNPYWGDEWTTFDKIPPERLVRVQ